MSIRTKYPNLLNALNDMASNPAYALRRDVLRDAELVIHGQEQRIEQLEKQLNETQRQRQSEGGSDKYA